jgi:hypothetical protein
MTQRPTTSAIGWALIALVALITLAGVYGSYKLGTRSQPDRVVAAVGEEIR